MQYPDNIKETIDLCSEDLGIDLAFEYQDNLYIIFDDTNRIIKLSESGEITHVLDNFSGAEKIELYLDIESEKLSIIGLMIYKWVKAEYDKVPPLFILEIWKHFDVDMIANSVDYDKRLTESVMRYLVYMLSNIEIHFEKPKKDIMKKLEQHLEDFLNFEREMQCSFCLGYIQALRRGTESDIILYI